MERVQKVGACVVAVFAHIEKDLQNVLAQEFWRQDGVPLDLLPDSEAVVDCRRPLHGCSAGKTFYQTLPFLKASHINNLFLLFIVLFSVLLGSPVLGRPDPGLPLCGPAVSASLGAAGAVSPRLGRLRVKALSQDPGAGRQGAGHALRGALRVGTGTGAAGGRPVPRGAYRRLEGERALNV